jgi:hypothetical protein
MSRDIATTIVCFASDISTTFRVIISFFFLVGKAHDKTTNMNTTTRPKILVDMRAQSCQQLDKELPNWRECSAVDVVENFRNGVVFAPTQPVPQILYSVVAYGSTINISVTGAAKCVAFLQSQMQPHQKPSSDSKQPQPHPHHQAQHQPQHQPKTQPQHQHQPQNQQLPPLPPLPPPAQSQSHQKQEPHTPPMRVPQQFDEDGNVLGTPLPEGYHAEPIRPNDKMRLTPEEHQLMIQQIERDIKQTTDKPDALSAAVSAALAVGDQDDDESDDHMNAHN